MSGTENFSINHMLKFKMELHHPMHLLSYTYA